MAWKRLAPGSGGRHVGPWATSDAITFARAVLPPVSLAKTIRVQDSSIVSVTPSRNAAIFEFTEEPVHDLDSLGAALEKAADRGDIAVRGKPKAERGRQAIYDQSEKGPAIRPSPVHNPCRRSAPS